MKPHKTFVPPQWLLDQIGSEYAGTYTVYVLDAQEYLETAETLTRTKRYEAQKQGETAEVFTESELRSAILYRCVTKDTGPLPKDLPSKLFEILSVVAIQLNMLTQDEGRQLLECFCDPKKDQHCALDQSGPAGVGAAV
ncbi:MAG: hypothetical protein LBH79_03220 [Nitrososphaerota archaeon]|jgi:hypothetical protein|nr:hypothetical protein [Nitrososphaerota archaeon]